MEYLWFPCYKHITQGQFNKAKQITSQSDRAVPGASACIMPMLQWWGGCGVQEPTSAPSTPGPPHSTLSMLRGARQAASHGVGGFSSRTQLHSQIRGFPPFPMLGVAACPASGPLLQQLGLFLCPGPAESPAGCWGLAAGMGSTNSSLQTTPGLRLSCTSSTGHCMSSAVPKCNSSAPKLISCYYDGGTC